MAPTRGCVENADPRERMGVVPNDPSMVRRVIAIRRERNIHNASNEQKTGALHFFNLVEADDSSAATFTRAGNGGINHNRTIRTLGSTAHIQGVQPVDLNET